jgi:hypothetical protein
MSTDLSPKAAEALKMVDLLDGESLQYSLQADGFFMGTHPILKLIASLQAMITTLTGGHIRVFLFVSNYRIILIQSTKVFCGMTATKSVKAMALGHLAEASWIKDTQMFCVHARLIQLQTETEQIGLVIKKMGDDALREYVMEMSKVILRNVEERTQT